MSVFVLDCSVAMSWCFEDEGGPENDTVYEAMHAKDCRVLVPCIFFAEVANALLISERRSRCSATKSAEFLQNLLAMPIYAVQNDGTSAIMEIHDLSRQHGLTAYDGFYLHLAMRHKVPLATRDGALRTAAARAGVQLLQLV